jgi:hypothetical protein
MTKEQAKEILEQAINAALIKGIYSLKDIKLILDAMSIVTEEK